MGNITQQYIARLAEELLEKYPTEFTDDFAKNKLKVAELCEVDSKGTRNKMAGLITHKIKQAKREAKAS